MCRVAARMAATAEAGATSFSARTRACIARRLHVQEGLRRDRRRDGEGETRSGKAGRDVIVRVPAGTTVRDVATGEEVADLVMNGAEIIAARGGLGGRGNARFVTSTRRAPRIATDGQAGEVRELELELRLIADVGLAGLPNAGKSSLLAALTRARPKIAAYPFTTLTPNLGVARLDERELVVADIPGLIEGASTGAGLGEDFLRHIERTRVVVHVVDASARTRSPTSRPSTTSSSAMDTGSATVPNSSR